MNQRLSRIGMLILAGAIPACGGSATGGAGGSDATSSGVGGSASTAMTTGTLATSSGSGATQPPAQTLYGSSIHNIVFEIDYAAGAEPYTGNVLGFGEVWDVAKVNVARLFKSSNKVVDIPSTIDQMEKLTDVTGADFTTEQILAIAAAHRDKPSSGDTATFYFVWLDGYYREPAGVRKDVLGVSLGTTGVLAMFKPVIAESGGGTPGLNIERYVEQATVVHEFGHAAGLVNNGLPLTSMHEDSGHEAHCSNQDCVMYWAIEGTSGAISYVQKSMLQSGTILWGAECLADADEIGSK